MASDERPVSMVMTCDDAVEMMFMDGSRVQLSPCGSCFIYDPPPSQAVSHPYHEPGPGPSHPLYTSTRTQQRTCFVTSRCRSKVKAALEFRNRFASCPFLCTATTQGESPLELYADITRMEWSNSSGKCTFNQLPDYSLELTSVDSLATMILSPSAQDFSVKYLCKLQPEGDTAMNIDRGTGHQEMKQLEFSEDNQESPDMWCLQRTSMGDMAHCQDFRGGGHISQGGLPLLKHCQSLGNDPMISRRLSPEERVPMERRRTRCKFWYTWVVQNHSVAHCPWYWRYPLDLLLNHHAELRKSLDVDESTHSHLENDATTDLGNRHDVPEKFQTHSSPVPPSLSLRCDQSHLHKHHWRAVRQECALDRSGEADSLTMYGRKVSVLVLGGVVYRLFWNPIPSIEIYPGNGDVIMSHDEGGSFFRLIKVCSDGPLKELMISVSNPPPDTPHSSYSIADLVRRASRLLHCMLVHLRTCGDRENLCCWKKLEKDDVSGSASRVLIERSIIPGLGQLEAYTDGLIRGCFNDAVTMETMCMSLVRLDARPVDLEAAKDEEPIFTVVMPGGLCKKVTSQNPGVYLRHMNALLEWKKWVWASSEERLALIEDKRSKQVISNSEVQAELLRIRNLTYILDAYNHGCERQFNALTGNQDKEGDTTLVSPSTEIHLNGHTLEHSNQTRNGNLTKEDIAKALHATAMTVCDIEGLLGNR